MRIGFICVTQETNDFNPRLTSLDDFRSYGILRGTEIDSLRDQGQYGGTVRAVAEFAGRAELVPILRGTAVAGGRISDEAFHWFAEAIRDGLAAAGPLDGLALHLHGACAAQSEDDVEGAYAALCRAILGPGVRIALGLDHHANITRKMVGAVDVVAGHRTQPHHPDDTGLVTGRLLLRILSEGLSPVTEWRKIPMLSTQEQFFTDRPPMSLWFDRARAIEAEHPGVLQVSPYPMQPWLDLAEGGWSVVVCTDGDRALAARLADEMADLAWSLRGAFQERVALPVDRAVLQAAAARKGIVLLSDTGDTVFGGAAGDSNVILEALLRLKIPGPALVPMIAPQAVERLWQAGLGAAVTLPLGGETATAFFTPLEVRGVVRHLHEGRIDAPGWRSGYVDQGRSALLELGDPAAPVLVMLTEKRGAAGNLPLLWQAHGVDMAKVRMAVMKTCTAFHLYDGFGSEVIRVDTPGPAQSDLFALPWRRIPRPVYPLDPIGDRHARGD